MEGLDAQLPVDPVPGQGGTAVVLAGVARGRDAGPLPLDEELIAVGQRLARLLHRGEDLSGERLPPALGAPVPQPQHRPESGGLIRVKHADRVVDHGSVELDRLRRLGQPHAERLVWMREPQLGPQNAQAGPEDEQRRQADRPAPPPPQRRSDTHGTQAHHRPRGRYRERPAQDPGKERQGHGYQWGFHLAVIGVIRFSHRCNHQQKNAGESVALLRVGCHSC